MGVPGLNYPAPPRAPMLGGAARQDPFGLAGGRSAPSPVALAAAGKPAGGGNPNAVKLPIPSQFTGGQNGAVPKASPGQAGYVSPYDLNTDPALQQANSLAGLSDQQAQSAATQQEQNLLLGYGDPNLINSLLHDPSAAAAAAANPNSTLNQLKTQHDQGLKTLDDGLNKANLDYSGYRVTQEQQAETDYQNQVAQAAATVNSGLDTINGSLAQALASDNASRISAINDAADRASQAAATSGVDPGATTGTGSPAAKKALVSAAARAVLPAPAAAVKAAAKAPAKPKAKTSLVGIGHQ